MDKNILKSIAHGDTDGTEVFKEENSTEQISVFSCAAIKKRRRFLFSFLYGFLYGGVAAVLTLAAVCRIPFAARKLRPPGALREPLFNAMCIRCNSCVIHCPTKLLQPLGLSDGYYGAPAAVFTQKDGTLSYCEKDCRKCSQVCPCRAIQKFTLDEKKNHKIGIAVFDFPKCLLYEDTECTVCERECPYEAIKYVWSEEEYRKIVVVDEEKCTGCGRCAARCPVCIKNKVDEKAKPLRIVPIEMPD